jgi:folate-dependent phosphoribosylglycinamide formyltransferase PurN
MSVVILAGEGDSTWILANALQHAVPLQAVIVERGMGKLQFARRRAAKLGWPTVLGQVLFILYSKILKMLSRSRSRQIMAEHGLVAEPSSKLQVIRVASANDASTISLLQRLGPRVVVVNGTGILSRRLLEAVNAVFINMHAGITPKYRGVHGGYWAMANGDAPHAGVTVHLVDAGIDTGGVLYQTQIAPGPRDNFCTYPLLQLSAGLPLMVRAVNDALAGVLKTVDPRLPSRLYHHPTLWGYWWTRLLRGVR